MLTAKREDRKIAVNIIAETFYHNPSVNIVIGNVGNRRKKIARLAAYAFTKSFNRNGAYLSENRKGVALCFHSSSGSGNLQEFILELRFALSIPLQRVLLTLRRESYIKKHRFNGPHLYFWFFGVEQGGEKAGFELIDGIFEMAGKAQLPIVLETSVARNRKIYERYQFEVYHVWPDSGDGKALWFMIRYAKEGA